MRDGYCSYAILPQGAFDSFIQNLKKCSAKMLFNSVLCALRGVLLGTE